MIAAFRLSGVTFSDTPPNPMSGAAVHGSVPL